jgi:hypothetical protein
MDFKQKYFKYKNKYLKLKNQEINSNSLREQRCNASLNLEGGSQNNELSRRDSQDINHTQGSPRLYEATTFCSQNEDNDIENYINNIENYNNQIFVDYIYNIHKTQKDQNGNHAYNPDSLTYIIEKLNSGHILYEYVEIALEIAIIKSKCTHNPKYKIYVDVVNLLNQYKKFLNN